MGASIAAQAREFARLYVQITEALQSEGVPEALAREEARSAATSWLITVSTESNEAPATYDPAQGPCPTCGRG